MSREPIARKIEIEGIVQGVGFRPFVYRLARELGLNGEVANTSTGVTIRLEGSVEKINHFRRDLTEKAPPLACITKVFEHLEMPVGYPQFSIIQSRIQHEKSALISPDVAICDDCLRELFDPADRRYRYPFINCTHCGPRYTIIDDIPYDRSKTSMKHFVMCALCQIEYDDPCNRRFHAQPNACPVCGPRVSLYDNRRNLIRHSDPIGRAAALIRDGHIVAVKGLGGFHLVADAENSEAVRKLRSRKCREEKPFAIMSCDADRILSFAHISSEEHTLITSSYRPIVLLSKKHTNPIAEEVSPRNNHFGVMLPYTPLHYLLLDAADFTHALVMTSGNLSEEPIAISNDDARDRLKYLADFFLVHDRNIILRSDDSILRRSANATRFIRRSRGYIPKPVFLDKIFPHILACGAELKNTICLTKGDRAFLSQHIGDLENLDTYEFMQLTVSHMERILDIRPEMVACDLHPDYLSTRYAEASGNKNIVYIQHHHAHIVSCMAENRIEGPVIGLSFDGTGYGSDGNIWGGEIFIAESHRFHRTAHLAYIPMPGSAAAIRDPWRMGISYLYDAFGKSFWDLDLPVLKTIDGEKITGITDMIDKQINVPLTSSLGRLFDGIASIMGLRQHVRYEGQAAVELETIADTTSKDFYECAWHVESVLEIPTGSIIRGVVADMEKRIPAPVISRKFHNTLTVLFSDLCVDIRKDTGLNKVVLSGGVFQNDLLLSKMIDFLEKRGFTVYSHHLVPSNDGGISLGQAVSAGSMMSK